MLQMWLVNLWWPKNPKVSATAATVAASSSSSSSSSSTTTTTTTTTRRPTTTNCLSCKRLSKLVEKLTKQGKRIRPCSWSIISNNKQSCSFQCRYDPMSYSLNFDTSGCGSFVGDHDQDYYYKFYAFSSRFVANNNNNHNVSNPTTRTTSCSSSSCCSSSSPSLQAN